VGRTVRDRAPTVFEGYSFWEKGRGKVWIFNGEATDPSEVEAIGMTFLRTRQDHWKPTGGAVTRFGAHATTNVIELDPEQAVTFAAGETRISRGSPEWDGDWGYLIATHEIAGRE